MQDEAKMSKPIYLHPIARAKISPNPRPTTYAGWEKPSWGKVGRGGTGRDKIGIPKYKFTSSKRLYFMKLKSLVLVPL